MAYDLKTFLKPHCVAIIGASRDASKRGNRAIQMLLDSKFAGRIVPINPKESEILSLRCYGEPGNSNTHGCGRWRTSMRISNASPTMP